MNIDALLEDLEAEGYFATSSKEVIEDIKTFSQQILVVRTDSTDLYLSLPLLGKNFIAGFVNKYSKSTWMIIQDYLYLQPQDVGTSLQSTKISLKRVIQAHLIGASLRLGVRNTSSEHLGYIIAVSGAMLEFVTYDAKSLWIPLGSISYLVVEKINTQTKL
jgi:hypothetical protein